MIDHGVWARARGLLLGCAVAAGLALGGPVSASAANKAPPPLLVSITSADKQVQGMGLILSLEALKHGAAVTVLLCGPAGDLALSGHRTPSLAPSGKTVQELLQATIAAGATAHVCGVYLPNTHRVAGELIAGVTPTKPDAIGALITRPDVQLLSY